MFTSLLSGRIEHVDRVKEAERHIELTSLIRDPSEQAPVVVYDGLWHQIKRRFQAQPSPRQATKPAVKQVHGYRKFSTAEPCEC